MSSFDRKIYYYRLDGMEFIYKKGKELYYPPHNHTSIYTVGIVLDGEVTVSRKGKNGTYTKGMCFAFPPYEPHSLKSEKEHELLTVCIDKQFLEKGVDKNAGEKSLFYDLERRIRENPEQEITIEELAKEVFMSEYHFIRVFKETVGLTPHRFLMQRRIRKAQRLLENGCPPAAVAFDAGFYDQSHFNKQFKYWLGITPMEYKAASVHANCNPDCFAGDGSAKGRNELGEEV
jgi:AraC-like DNA-binding protein